MAPAAGLGDEVVHAGYEAIGGADVGQRGDSEGGVELEAPSGPRRRRGRW